MILAITWRMSFGARNCPFLTLTTLPVRAAATMRSVWRERNAGIWMTSTTSATRSACEGSWMSVRIGSPVRAFTSASVRRPDSRPGPRNDCPGCPIGFVVRGLEDRAERRTGPAIPLMRSASSEACARALDDARPGDEGDRTAAPDRQTIRSEPVSRPYSSQPARASSDTLTVLPVSPTCAGTTPRRSSRRAGAA